MFYYVNYRKYNSLTPIPPKAKLQTSTVFLCCVCNLSAHSGGQVRKVMHWRLASVTQWAAVSKPNQNRTRQQPKTKPNPQMWITFTLQSCKIQISWNGSVGKLQLANDFCMFFLKTLKNSRLYMHQEKWNEYLHMHLNTRNSDEHFCLVKHWSKAGWYVPLPQAFKRKRQEGCWKSEASLVYIVNSRPARAKQLDLVS